MTKKSIDYARLYINDSELTYKIRHSKKAKYIRLQINSSTGLEVIIPRGYKFEDAEKFIFKKREWILKHLRSTPVAKEYTYLGETIRIKQRYDLFVKKHKISLNNNILLVESSSGSSDDINFIFNTWLKYRAKSYLPARVEALARKHNFKFRMLRIRGQKTRWGSCSASGNISLNYRLMKYRKELIDYVIIHELCHLEEMNHSKKFWKLVEKIMPDYKLLKHELKTQL